MKGLLRTLYLLCLLLFLCSFAGCAWGVVDPTLPFERTEESFFSSGESDLTEENTLSESERTPSEDGGRTRENFSEESPVEAPPWEAQSSPNDDERGSNGAETETPAPPQRNDPPEEDPTPISKDPAPLYIEPTSDYEEYTAVCAVANLNLRAGQGTDTAVLGSLATGRSLPYLGREGGWYAVWWKERVAYVSAAYSYLAETCRATERILEAGLQKLGTPYLWGAARILDDKGNLSPYFTGKSFDCSSFLQYCFYVGDGVKLGNYTGSQADYTVGKVITRYTDLRRGDFYFTGDGKISHVVLYMGGGRLLQAYSANGGPVSFTTDDKWKGKFISGRRVDLSVKEQYK